MAQVVLGLGLLSIGRQWGVNAISPPKPKAARSLIVDAFADGIRFFDTAPAYAHSEDIFGQVLQEKLIDSDRILIATKAGEHWDINSGGSYVDHSYAALSASIRNSLDLLGRIDLLQIHKANITNVVSRDVLKALDHAENLGVGSFGVSVSDIECARAACQTGRYKYIQFPFNKLNINLAPIFDIAAQNNVIPIVNRPFAMGALSSEPVDQFQFVTRHMKSGIILTGTSNSAHLSENIASFKKASS